MEYRGGRRKKAPYKKRKINEGNKIDEEQKKVKTEREGDGRGCRRKEWNMLRNGTGWLEEERSRG